MRKTRRFILREKEVLIVGFSLAFPRFPQTSKKRLNASLIKLPIMVFSRKVIFRILSNLFMKNKCCHVESFLVLIQNKKKETPLTITIQI